MCHPGVQEIVILQEIVIGPKICHFVFVRLSRELLVKYKTAQNQSISLEMMTKENTKAKRNIR
jgi:hypothetical protein